VCEEPAPDECRFNSDGYYEAHHFDDVGTCDVVDPTECFYDGDDERCSSTETCEDGACVLGSACSLDSAACGDSHLACKLDTNTDSLRCVPVDTFTLDEGDPACDEDELNAGVGGRCGALLTCVFPSFEMAPVCAYLCEVDSDCAGVGLQGAHDCVDVPGSVFGFCR
jgi:hypothetical protein